MADITIRNIGDYDLTIVNGDLQLTYKIGQAQEQDPSDEEHAAMYAAEQDPSDEEHTAMYAEEQLLYVSKEELIASVTDSTILESLVRSGDTVISTSLNYRSIVKDILSTMTRKQLIEDKGRPCPKKDGIAAPNYWLVHEDAYLDIENTVWQSRKNNTFEFRGVNSVIAIYEILHLVNINHLTIELTILTKQGVMIHYRS